MKKIQFKFQTDIISNKFKDEFYIHGPLFHRWFPNGEKDAIVLPTTKNKIEISVWFNRCGSVVNGFCMFSREKNEIDEKVMIKQGKLDAGRLFVKCKNIKIGDDAYNILNKNKIGDEKYKKLAKKLSKEIIPSVNSFIEVLKINFGQYWLQKLKPYDSRSGNLGHYWSILFAKWKTLRGKKWHRFKPEEGKISLNVTVDDDCYKNYLTKSDWEHIKKSLKDINKNIFATEILATAYELSDSGNLRYAFLEATLALELALNNFYKVYKEKFQSDKDVYKQLNQFFNLSLASKFVTTSASIERFSISTVKNAVKAISIRNKIAHEGYFPKPNDKICLLDLLKITNEFLPSPGVRKIELTSSNCLRSPGKWKEIYNKNT